MSIQVKVVNAVLSHDTEFFSNMDPYCVLQLGSQKYRSKTKSQAGKKPVWNQTFNFTGQDSILKVTVMDEDTVTDDLVGEGSVDISKFRTTSGEQQEFCELFYKGKKAGRVQLMIKGSSGGMGGNNAWGGQQNNIMGGINQGFGQQGGNQGGWGQQGAPSNNDIMGGIYKGLGQQGGNQGGWGQQGAPSNNDIMGGIYQGFGQQGGNQGGWGQQQGGNQWGGNKPMNQGPVNQGAPSQWGNLNDNNGWGNFQTAATTPSNPYPSLDNNVNPLQMLGAAFGQGGGPQAQQQQSLDTKAQYEMVNGMGMLGGMGSQNNNNPYGANPYK